MTDEAIYKMYEAGYSLNYIIACHFSALRGTGIKKHVTKRQVKIDVYNAIYNRLMKRGF